MRSRLVRSWNGLWLNEVMVHTRYRGMRNRTSGSTLDNIVNIFQDFFSHISMCKKSDVIKDVHQSENMVWRFIRSDINLPVSFLDQ
jgi:hypothetical protein